MSIEGFEMVERGYTPRRRGGKVPGLSRDCQPPRGTETSGSSDGVRGGEAAASERLFDVGVGREGEDWVVVVAEDEDGRELRTTAPFEPLHAGVRRGMACEAVVFSADGFETLFSTSEVFVPGADAWLGPYPYLDRSEFRRFLAARKRRKK